MIAITGAMLAKGFMPRVVVTVVTQLSLFYSVVAYVASIIGIGQICRASGDAKILFARGILHILALLASGFFLVFSMLFFSWG